MNGTHIAHREKFCKMRAGLNNQELFAAARLAEVKIARKNGCFAPIPGAGRMNAQKNIDQIASSGAAGPVLLAQDGARHKQL